MKAFVSTVNGNFPNVNYYLAWLGFTELGYSVQTFDDYKLMDFTKDTPVFAGARTFEAIVEKLGVKYNRVDTYPEVLKPYICRDIKTMTLREAKDVFGKVETPMFVKPVHNKRFNGALWKSFLDLIPLGNVPDETEVFVSEPVNFVSEFRVYVNQGDIVGIKHYTGDLRQVPSDEFIKEALRVFRPVAPAGYSLDVGVVKDKFCIPIDEVIEVNDGTSLGNYGLDSVHYAELLLSRWVEICNS